MEDVPATVAATGTGAAAGTTAVAAITAAATMAVALATAHRPRALDREADTALDPVAAGTAIPAEEAAPVHGLADQVEGTGEMVVSVAADTADRAVAIAE